MSESFNVRVAEGQTVTAIEYPPPGAPVAGLILGHGAGANQHHVFMVDVASALARRGVKAITFNFPYTEQGRGIPDRQPILENCYAQVIATVAAREGDLPLFIGGKSMGGRIASHVAAGEPTTLKLGTTATSVVGPGSSLVIRHIRGLVFLGYPLHPPGKPQQLRDRHLPAIAAPMLFIQGSRDSFGTPPELEPVLAKLNAPHTLHVVEGGDHSLKVSRKTGPTHAEILEGVCDRMVSWMADVARG